MKWVICGTNQQGRCITKKIELDWIRGGGGEHEGTVRLSWGRTKRESKKSYTLIEVVIMGLTRILALVSKKLTITITNNNVMVINIQNGQ